MAYQKIGFPSIDVTKPFGSYRVSTVDNHERETRRWLKQCLQAISGYPEIDTVGIIGWTDTTRPKRSPNGNYLLGYNTSQQCLEIIGEDGSIANITRAMSLAAHPVGSIYETTDKNFNPNTEWGGVWEFMNDGRFLLSTSSQRAVNSIGGEEEHTLIEKEIPRHDHKHSHFHNHTRGTMNITGTFFGENDGGGYPYSGAFEPSVDNNNRGIDGGDGDNKMTKFDASKSWEGSTSNDDTVNSDSYVGGGQAHNNMPPYLVVCRWHRIA